MQDSDPLKTPDTAFSTERVLSASPQKVFEAFENAELLAQWWGPDGFTNTFQQFDFVPEGKWLFVMHGPNGANHFNESIFREIVPAQKIVVEHVVSPWFKLTVSLLAEGANQTRLTWVQEFDNADFLEKMRGFLETANGQVLDRLAAVLGK